MVEEEEVNVPTLIVGLALIFASGFALTFLLWITLWRPTRLDFLMPELLDAPSNLIAQTTRARAVAMGHSRQARRLATNTLAYVSTVNQLMAQGLSLVQANARLQVRPEGGRVQLRAHVRHARGGRAAGVAKMNFFITHTHTHTVTHTLTQS